ncbi:MAG: hypothetical protein WBD55_01985 [Dehalococcoidia bacterium]
MPETPLSIETAVQQLAGLFAGRTRDEQKALLAALERAGAGVYRALAADEPDASLREALLAAAAREERNAEVLEGALGG